MNYPLAPDITIWQVFISSCKILLQIKIDPKAEFSTNFLYCLVGTQ